MNTRIKFSIAPEIYSIGRNGAIKTSGIALFKVNNTIYISPITSRDAVGNCQIVLPTDHVDELIELLKTFK